VRVVCVQQEEGRAVRKLIRDYKPMSHQVEASRFLLEHRCGGVVMDIGWGKTAAALDAVLRLMKSKVIRKILLVAPKRVCELTWPLEIAEWRQFQHLRTVFLHGKDKDKLINESAEIYLINPEGLEWLLKSRAIGKIKPDLLLVDESTMFKNTTTKRFKLLKVILKYFKRRWIMTGEPAPKGLLDLFGQVFIIDMGNALGQYVTHYRYKYFQPAGFKGYDWKLQDGADKLIYERLRGVICRPKPDPRLKRPKELLNPIYFNLSDAAYKVYCEIEDEMFSVFKGQEIKVANAAVATQKCRQVTSGALYKSERANNTEWIHIHDDKMEAMEGLIESLQGKPLFLLYEFDHELQRITKKFKNAVVFDGKVRELEAIQRHWNNGEIELLLAQPQSSGRGLNLQKACSHVCWFTLPWDLEIYKQGNGRIARQGAASKFVSIHYLTAKNTVDEYVISVLRRKNRTQDDLKLALQQLHNDRRTKA